MCRRQLAAPVFMEYHTKVLVAINLLHKLLQTGCSKCLVML
jgi:hypothetical protein